jgi:predicted metal-dependent hydrolase
MSLEKKQKKENILYVYRFYKRSKNVRIRVCLHSVYITAPFYMQKRRIESVVERQRKWIEEKHKKVIEKYAHIPLLPLITEEYKKEVFLLAKERLDYFAKKIGVSYFELRIVKGRSFWGSCTQKGKISIHCHIKTLPQELQDYIFIHELCHRKEMNHSPRFWALVEEYSPHYKKYRKEIKEKYRVE